MLVSSSFAPIECIYKKSVDLSGQYGTRAQLDMSPTSYKALVVTAPLGEYVVKSVPLPTPGSGQLLVKVAGAALNYIDYKLQVWGWYEDSYLLL